jgi:uncharacterized repeat protein (TIGR03803 family)
MRGKRLSIRLIATLAIFTAILFVTGTWAAAQVQEEVLHNFNNDGTDGVSPWAGLIFDAAGNLYGTARIGGAYTQGMVFELIPAAGGTWTEKVLHNFDGTDGGNPTAGLILDTAGNLYGTTVVGGTYGHGTVFELSPAAGGTWTEQVLYSFNSNGTDGVLPAAGLIFDAAGNLYGTTSAGGSYSGGTVFELTPAAGGTWTEKVLYSFGNDADGATPYAGLIFDAAGNLYGTTFYGGGTYALGTVFELTPAAGGTWTEKVLHSFTGNGTDGANLSAGLIFDAAGNLYGTTTDGGTIGGGTAFELTPAAGGTWTESMLHNFGNGTDASMPRGALIFDAAGNLYGASSGGGAQNAGTVFELTPAGGGTWTEQVLHNFGSGTDGANPYAGMIFDAAGNLFGTTKQGGTSNDGTVFEVTPPIALQFVPLGQPCRAVDTRPGQGGGGPIQGGTFQSFPISGAGTCGIMTSAAAYSMNVSVVPQGYLGYLTVWPAGQPQPLVSTLNSLDGRIKANAAIIPAGTNGQISVYARNTTNVIVDVNGYFAPVSGSTLAFYPLTPCRVADTRHDAYPPGLGPPYLTGGQERAFPILNATTTCNIPSSGVAAYSLNFSVVPHGSLFYMTVWPTGETRPTVSTLNDIPGQIIANAAIVTAGTSGDVSVYPTNDTDVVIDINGYFAATGTGGLSLYGVQPCRVIDTRHVGSGQPFSGTLSPPVDVMGSPCGVPSTAQAYVFNASVVPQGALGYLTLWPDGATQPLVSTLNALDGSISSNMAIVPNQNGKIDAYASGLTQLILDISSYFAP